MDLIHFSNFDPRTKSPKVIVEIESISHMPTAAGLSEDVFVLMSVVEFSIHNKVYIPFLAAIKLSK